MRSFFHQEQPPTGGERSNAAPSAHHPSKGGERSNAAGAQAVRRQTTVTRAPRSRARLQHEPTRRRLVAKPRTPHLIPQAAQRFKIETANVRGQGARPLAFLWGFKRGYSLRKENTPFVWQQRSALHYHCSANGAAPSRPLVREESKGKPSSEREYPLCLAVAQSAA